MSIYRRFEMTLKQNGFQSVKDYESSLDGNHYKQEQVRICRTIRNYIEHENQSFVEATDNMISFIESEIVSMDNNQIPVKKKMISVKNAIRETDLIVVAADFMTKKNESLIPVFDSNDFAVGAICYHDIVKLIASGDFTKARKVSLIQTQHKFGFVKDWTPMNQLVPLLEGHKKIYLVLNDSKKVVGWIV